MAHGDLHANLVTPRPSVTLHKRQVHCLSLSVPRMRPALHNNAHGAGRQDGPPQPPHTTPPRSHPAPHACTWQRRQACTVPARTGFKACAVRFLHPVRLLPPPPAPTRRYRCAADLTRRPPAPPAAAKRPAPAPKETRHRRRCCLYPATTQPCYYYWSAATASNSASSMKATCTVLPAKRRPLMAARARVAADGSLNCTKAWREGGWEGMGHRGQGERESGGRAGCACNMCMGLGLCGGGGGGRFASPPIGSVRARGLDCSRGVRRGIFMRMPPCERGGGWQLQLPKRRMLGLSLHPGSLARAVPQPPGLRCRLPLTAKKHMASPAPASARPTPRRGPKPKPVSKVSPMPSATAHAPPVSLTRRPTHPPIPSPCRSPLCPRTARWQQAPAGVAP